MYVLEPYKPKCHSNLSDSEKITGETSPKPAWFQLLVYNYTIINSLLHAFILLIIDDNVG